MKTMLSLLITCALPFFVFSQTSYRVTGILQTADGHLPSGNIMALRADDSTFVKGDYFLDGQFELSELTEQNLLLQFTSLEFADYIIPVHFDQQRNVDLGTLVVNTSGLNLNEVVVKTKRPSYVQKADGTVEVMIENTSLASSNSVQEILSKSPDVVTNEDGELTLFGKGKAIIYLNGKRIDNC
ncbi:MAG: hypothetical protein AAFO94_18100 [Bacteroidota bacterium]